MAAEYIEAIPTTPDIVITGAWICNDPYSRWREYTTGSVRSSVGGKLERTIILFEEEDEIPFTVFKIPTSDQIFVNQEKDQMLVFAYRFEKTKPCN